MNPYWQYELPLWLILISFLASLLAPMELGFWLGRRERRAHVDAEGAARSDVTLASMLALLGLMLAFTYSFCMSRADLRKKALITEVNALGTAFVRADLLPEPGRTEVRERLFDYAKSRRVTPGTVTTYEQVQEVVKQSMDMQSKIWPAVHSALRQTGGNLGSRESLTGDRHQRRAGRSYQSDGRLL